jgi:hypothetical protein
MALVLGLLGLSAAAQEFGRIVYLEGSVAMFHEGEEQYADIGTGVFPGDLIRTGSNGYVELEVNTGPTMIYMEEDTVLSVDRRTGGGRTETSFELLRGDVDAVVDRLTGNESVRVNTHTVAAGVRGTEFKVRTSPDDSAVVGVTEGTVAVEQGRDGVTADAGTAVESVDRGSLQRTNVGVEDMDAFLERWKQTRLQAFRNGADTFVVAYAERYLDQYPSFLEVYTELSSYTEDLREAAEDSGIAGRGRRFRLRSEVSGPAVRMRSLLPLFQNTFYRLGELSEFHAEGIGQTRIHDELTSRDFFRTFDSRQARTERRLSHVRYLMRLYRQLEEGTMGGLPSGESPFGSDDMVPDF